MLDDMLEKMTRALTPPRLDVAESCHVWNSQQFALLVEIQTMRRRLNSALGLTEPPRTIWGIPVLTDRTLPDGVCEFRGPDGKVLLRVEGL